jgi:hypothetical protein
MSNFDKMVSRRNAARAAKLAASPAPVVVSPDAERKHVVMGDIESLPTACAPFGYFAKVRHAGGIGPDGPYAAYDVVAFYRTAGNGRAPEDNVLRDVTRRDDGSLVANLKCATVKAELMAAIVAAVKAGTIK